MINEQLENKQQDINKQLAVINKLFNDLFNIYKYKFPKELILYDLIDCTKLQLFKQIILELITNPICVQVEWNKFKQQIRSINSLPKLNELIKQHILNILLSIKILDNRDKRKILFYVSQSLNYTLKQQPQIMLSLFNSNNIKNIEKNFSFNIEKFLTDLINNNGYFNIKSKAQHLFMIGINIATTKNSIIYNNTIMRLIKYMPNQIKYKTPILFIPPCTNKHYILDLSANNSLIKWLINQGFIVYVIDWLNPKSPYTNTTFADYITNGTVQAINIITQQHASAIHLAGYCMGGTMLSCTLSYVQQLKIAKILSATYLMTSIDFISFKTVHKQSLDNLFQAINKIGYLDGSLLCTVFHIIHSDELIWPYFINHYLLNKPLSNFDALYWYSDPINLPATMYNFYMQEICFNNKLHYANKLVINNIKINLKAINVPVFSVAGEHDPIGEWQLVYESMKIYNKSKNKQFVLARGGHISSLLASPKDNNNVYKINNTIEAINQDSSSWYNNSTEIQGSWWNYWKDWLQNQET